MQTPTITDAGHYDLLSFFSPWWVMGGIAFVLLAITLYAFRRRRKPD